MKADDRSWMRPLGTTGLTVSAVTAGGGPLGSMPQNFGYEVQEEEGIALVEAVLSSPIRCLDTANGYSGGASERRIGKAIERFGGLPPDFQVFTKVDARGRDYSGERVRISLQESKARLGLSHLPLVFLHDPEYFSFEEMTRPGGAVDTLVRLRDQGEVGHIGLAGGEVHEMSRYLALGCFEVLLVHNRWTLVDHSAEDLIAQAAESHVPVVNAAIYGGGILANTRGGRRDYAYRPAAPETLRAVELMDELCGRWNVSLASVAVAASIRDPHISTTIVGFSKPERIAGLVAAFDLELPDEFWGQLDELRPPREVWLDWRKAGQ